MSDLWNEIFEDPQSPITEEFDPSWKFNFKWTYDAMTGTPHVWRTQGGKDGRPAHRGESEARMGRPPRVQDGDTLGLATYVPAEVKLDGTLVAPPEVQIQPYYQMPIPPAIRQWFEDQFPTASVRQATIVPPRLGSTKLAADWTFEETEPEPMYKWIWNESDGLLIWETQGIDDMPYHETKAVSNWNRPINASDVAGYAFMDSPEPGCILVEERYASKTIPPQAFAAVKAQLAEWCPQYQIINGGQEQIGFNSDPHDYHAAAVAWAQEHLSEAPVSPVEAKRERRGVLPGLRRLFRKKPVWEKTAEADMKGAMVALFLSEEDGKKIQIEGGEALDQLHITLLFFSDKAADRDDWHEIQQIVEQIANQTPPMSGKVSGYGVFSNDEEVLWASPSVQGLAELRHKLFEACEDAGFHVSTDHDWAPHITLKYGWKGKLPKIDDEITLDFKNLSFAKGGKDSDFEFKGHLEKKADWEIPFDYEDYVQPQYGEVPPRLYHVAPSGARESILKEGLDATGRTWNTGGAGDLSDWQDGKLQYGDGDEWRSEAIYMFNNQHNAREYAGWGWVNQTADISQHDVWEINTSQVSDILRDPSRAHNWGYDPDEDVAYMTEYVPPSALRLVDPSEHLASDDYLDWSGWEGAHRFVTDGKEIMTDPQTEPINEREWAMPEELGQTFRSFHPDSKGFASGWIVPTTDKLGLGVYAPAAGHGDKHEPGLHEIIAVIEKEFGKPAHMITNPDHLTDDKMYNPGTVSEWQTLS